MFRGLALQVFISGIAFAQPTPYNSAAIVTCVGEFGPIVGLNGCTTQASSTGSLVNAAGMVTTAGETAAYTASSSSRPTALRGSAVVTTNTLNNSGPGVMVDAIEQHLDIVTINVPPFNGRQGKLTIQYSLSGANTATGANASAVFGGHRVPYACVKAGINTPTFPFGCVAYDQPAVNGIFLSPEYTFTYGQPFPLWFQLESIAGTGFGPGRPLGPGSSSAEFSNTAAIAALQLLDPNGAPLTVTPSITSALGSTYAVVTPQAVPTLSMPALVVLAAALAGIALRLRAGLRAS